MVAQSAVALAAAVAQAAAFTATAPIFPEFAAPRPARVALAIVLTPLLLHNDVAHLTGSPIAAIAQSGVTGAAFGLTASVVAGAVKAAGDLIDTALGSPPFLERAPSTGPIARLYQLAYAFVLLESGGLMTMLGALAHASARLQHPLLGLYGLAVLGSASIGAALTLAGPPLFAQALAALAAGLFARTAPGLGGVLFSTSFTSAFVLLAVAIGAAVLWPELAGIVRDTIGLSRVLDR